MSAHIQTGAFFMQDTIDAFLQAWLAHDILPDGTPEILPDDKWHRVKGATDKGAQKTIYYRLKIEDGFAVGNFGSYREGITHTWTSKTDKSMSREDRDEWKRKTDEARAKRDDERKRQAAEAATLAKQRWAEAEIPIEDHPYLVRKGVRAAGLRCEGDNLIIPMTDVAGKMHGLQTISPAGDKLYMFGARKEGCFYPFPADDKTAIIICEGIATAASVAMAIPEHPVLAAFDAGNLVPVAEAVRMAYPEAVIIIAADNDAFTANQKGEPRNVGVEKAQQAAMKAKGFAIAPEFNDNEETKYTDWNDKHQVDGLESVREGILRVMPVGDAPAGDPVETPVSVGVQTPAGGYIEESQGDFGLPFRVLGYNQETYYYFPFEKRQIFALSGSSHTLNNLLQLASLDQWQRQLGGGVVDVSPSQISSLAANALFRIAHERGVFSEENKVRGCGAWLDAGRRMLHCGDTIYVDGTPTDPKNVKGAYVYVAAPRLFKPSNTPLTNAEAIKLRQICEMPTWETKLSGSLLAGWLVIAPVCSILPWRPHIWITGEAEAGKSTILDKIIKPVMGSIALTVDGGTSEPAIRTMMGYDGRPIIYDEAESETQSQRTTMEGVLALARKASSGAIVAKYGQRPFKAQFCACFSAINPGVTAFADESRISMLVLKKNRKRTAQQDYDNLLNIIADTITPEFQAGLLARTVENMPTLLKNIEVFRRAVRTVLNAARVADQLAPMLAGLYLLGSDKVIDAEAAEKWVAEQDWTMNTAVAHEPDHNRLLRHIATSIVRAGTKRESQSDYTVGELIEAMVKPIDGISKDFADRTLRMYSIAYKDGYVDIGYRNHNLGRLLKGTQWEISWHRALSDVEGSEKRNLTYFAAGDKQRSIRIPVHTFLSDEVLL
ncbi:MAG: toprim domain-containing protein [Leptolyngbyaceae bacterium]|nr:toprim domain-containing protein [Leptolyngbyaceae bacterium]